MSDKNRRRDRIVPVAKRPSAQGPFETTMAIASRLPGTLGYIARRKLQRRHCARAQDTFSEVLADTDDGELCIDLGANVGEFSLRMAATGADVISFEPDPGAFSVLQKVTADVPNKWSADDPGANTESSSLIAKNQTTADANAVEVEVVDIIAFIENLDRDVRIIKMDIEGAEWEIMNRLVDHPVLSRIDCIFVETHERIDPAKYVPMFDALQERAEQLSKPYINLYWI